MKYYKNLSVTDRVDTMYGAPALTADSDAIPDLQLKTSKSSKESRFPIKLSS